MTRTRTEFPESVKRAALGRAGYRCQDKLCWFGGEWHTEVWAPLYACDVQGPVRTGWTTINDVRLGASLVELEALRTAIMGAWWKHRKAMGPIIKRFRLDGGALLEVDHEREDADGGAATLENALVRCVFCHLFKTLERAKRRRKGPQIAKKQPEQLDLVHRAKVEGVRQLVGNQIPGKVVRVDHSGQVFLPALHRAMSTPILAPEPEAKPRRHTSESAFQAAAQRRERAILDNDGFFGA